MKWKWALRGVAGLAVLAVFGLGIAYTRPDVFAALKSWRIPTEPADPTPGPASTPVELVADGWCLAHQRPEADCPACTALGAPTAERACLERLPIVRLAGPGVARAINLETAEVVARMHTETLSGNAEVAYNEKAYAEVRPRVAGLVRTIETDTGRLQKKGDVLATVDSADVGAAKAQYLAALPVVTLAQATYQRTHELTKANALPLKDELEASTALNRARAEMLNAAQRLKNLGFDDANLAAIEAENDTASILKVVAPIDGTIVSRHAVAGEAVDPLHQLFVITDINVMWAWIDIDEAHIERVQPGRKVELRIGGMAADRVFEGAADWIDTAVNPATRTIRVRAEVKNKEGLLRDGQFGRAEIIVGEPHQAVMAPRQAVQSTGVFNVVFLPRDDGSFRPQRVLLNDELDSDGDLIEVHWGVEPGQHVVTTRSFELKAELLKLLGAADAGG